MRTRSQRGAAAIDFVLSLVVVLPLVLGLIHAALLLHVRNSLVSAAAEGARLAAAADGDAAIGEERTREQIGSALAARFARDIDVRTTTRDGLPVVEVAVVAKMPPLGLWGPAMTVHAAGHAIREP